MLYTTITALLINQQIFNFFGKLLSNILVFKSDYKTENRLTSNGNLTLIFSPKSLKMVIQTERCGKR